MRMWIKKAKTNKAVLNDLYMNVSIEDTQTLANRLRIKLESAEVLQDLVIKYLSDSKHYSQEPDFYTGKNADEKYGPLNSDAIEIEDPGYKG